VTSSRQRHSRRLPGGLGALAPTVLLLSAVAGCGGTGVAVSLPSPPPDQVKVCRALHRALPDKVSGLPLRGTDPASDLTAAWGSGDDAVVLRCGIPRPAQMSDPRLAAVDADGVSWLAEEPSSGWRFTTTYRVAYVQVTLGPGHQDGTLIAQLAAAVRKTDPSSV
jgi:hypothetical protein